jgi:hypothetical protein
MGFEENRDDYWRGRGDSPHSKMSFLKTAVECGAVQTGYWHGHECPYYGAHAHAEELVREGLLKKQEGHIIWPARVRDPLVEESIWIPTDEGKKAVASCT